MTKTLYAEEEYPLDGDDKIRSQIVSFASTEYTPGKELIPSRLFTPIYKVPGIETAVIEVAVTTNPGDTPSYVTTTISIADSEIVEMDVTRITVI